MENTQNEDNINTQQFPMEIFQEELHTTENSIQIIHFTIAENAFGINILETEEIIRVDTITHIPRSPAEILGVINLHGFVIPVLSLRSLLNLPEQEKTKNTRIIVIEEEHYGILVDSVKEIVSIQREGITPFQSQKQHFIDTAFIGADDTLLPLINTHKLLQTTIENVQKTSSKGGQIKKNS